MARQKYAMHPGEKIVYKTSCVRHGVWGGYTDALIVTNQSVIWEKYGVLNQFRGFERFDASHIHQVIVGKASNGGKQLELYMGERIETFTLQSADEVELNVLAIAINDQINPGAAVHDINYYQNLLSEAKASGRLPTLRKKARHIQETLGVAMGAALGSALDIAGDATKNLLDSGDFRVTGVINAVVKAAGQKKAEGTAVEDKVPKAIGSEKISVKEQMEMLQNLKELLDAGVVTQEEFQQKKREILDS